jgi:hypothetical protein
VKCSARQDIYQRDSESKPAQAGLSGNTGTDETIRNQTEIEMSNKIRVSHLTSDDLQSEDRADPDTFDMTPNWKFAMRVYITTLQDGTGEGRRAAAEDLMRLAAQVDDLPSQGSTVAPQITYELNKVMDSRSCSKTVFRSTLSLQQLGEKYQAQGHDVTFSNFDCKFPNGASIYINWDTETETGFYVWCPHPVTGTEAEIDNLIEASK